MVNDTLRQQQTILSNLDVWTKSSTTAWTIRHDSSSSQSSEASALQSGFTDSSTFLTEVLDLLRQAVRGSSAERESNESEGEQDASVQRPVAEVCTRDLLWLVHQYCRNNK